MINIEYEELLPVVIKIPSLRLPSNSTEEQKNFWEYQKNIWKPIARYLDYLEKLEHGLNPIKPFPAPDNYSEAEAALINYLEISAKYYWQSFQVIKVGWGLIKPDPQNRINIFDTPRTVFYKCLEEAANRPLKLASSKYVETGKKSIKEMYEELKTNYKFYRGSLDKKTESIMREKLAKSDIWDWCMYCIWEDRFNPNVNPSNFPGTHLAKAFSDFCRAHRSLNGFFNKNRKHFTTFVYNGGHVVSSKGRKIDFSPYLLNKT
ncbi:hypothetical protein [Myxosarcina sp. GI1]|uniref:hypothetical protein n=1 Tax=Myxosarcina sp. GI1 TaxID=1541065 RepID=UPI00055B4718|nr:hypothetical protein [Myxosarcina sp. GI1]